MSQKIWIVRHGNREDFHNPSWARTAQRPHDPALSADGKVQAQEVGHSLRGEAIDRIFASPFLRTIQTASHIADALDQPVFLEPGIGEILPTVQQMPALLSPQERTRQFPRLGNGHQPVGALAFPESADAGLQRAARAAQALADAYPQDNLLIVTHAAPVVGIVRGLAGVVERITVPLCCLFTLERADDQTDAASGWRILRQSDVSHLSDPATSRRFAHTG